MDETRYRRWAGCVKADWTDADPRFPVTNAGVPAEGSFTPCCFVVLMQPILLTKQGHRVFDKERNVVPESSCAGMSSEDMRETAVPIFSPSSPSCDVMSC